MIIPKIIENLREQILVSARELLMQKGYRLLTIRDVASRCDIAVGTLYNYFPSKDMLVASFMLKDWLEIMATVRTEIGGASSCMEALEAIFNGVKKFSIMYETVWEEYVGSFKISGEYHARTVAQIWELVTEALDRFDIKVQPDPARFLAEIILDSGSKRNLCFLEFAPFIEKLLR